MAADTGSITFARAPAKIKFMIWGSNRTGGRNGGEEGFGGGGGAAGFVSGTYSYSNVKNLSISSIAGVVVEVATLTIRVI